MSSNPEANQLPKELAEFLRDETYACLMQETDLGTVFVVKAPRADIESLRGRVPIHLRQELHQHPAAPVIRMVLTIYDQPTRPLAFETFVNVADPQQQSEFAGLSRQSDLHLLLYDESLRHRLSKQMPLSQGLMLPDALKRSSRMTALIDRDHFDFDRAKAEVMRSTSL